MMKFNKKIPILIVFSVMVWIIFTPLVLADVVCTGPSDPYCLPNPFDAESFEEVVEAIAKWLYIVAIPLATIMILYAAFLFMTSAGDEEKIKKAKRALTWTLVGVAIIVIGSGFINLIKDLLNR